METLKEASVLDEFPVSKALGKNQITSAAHQFNGFEAALMS